jgi:parallel beta-helix repeat protein/predicted outer membrane repeat protein
MHHPTIEDSIIHSNGGRGISVDNMSNVTLTGSEIYGNTGGGLLYVRTISNTTIRNNSVTGNGGGIYGSPALTNVIIKDNTATGNGGGIYCDNYSAHNSFAYEKVTLTGNEADGIGGGGYIYYCYPTFTNSLVADNSASSGGGLGIDIWASIRFKNSTLVNNTASTGNGGLFVTTNTRSGGVDFANSIVWVNRATSGTGHIGSYINTNVFNNFFYDSIIENNGDSKFTDDGYFSRASTTVGLIDSGTNYDTDPNFVNPHADGDYHINTPSDAIDNAADNSGWGIPNDDLEGNSRPAGDEDIGAYEYQVAGGDAAPVLSWTGQADYVDDGVNPDSGAGGISYEFRVDYTHADNIAPDPVEVWVDQNSNDAYESDEKFAMTVLASSDTYDDGNYANTERYTKTITIYKD